MSVVVVIDGAAAEYGTPLEAAAAMIAALPRRERNPLAWMEWMRRVNQAEAGVVPTGKVGENAVPAKGER